MFLIGLLLFSRLFVRPLAAAVGGNESSAVKDLRKEVMTKLATVQIELAGGVVPPELSLASDSEGSVGYGAPGESGDRTGGGDKGNRRSGQVAAGRGVGDLEIPGLMDPNGSIPLPAQVDRLAQLRPEDSVRTIRSWMSAGS